MESHLLFGVVPILLDITEPAGVTFTVLVEAAGVAGKLLLTVAAETKRK